MWVLDDHPSCGKSSKRPVKALASQSIPTSNQIISWLKEIESIRKLLPALSGLAEQE